jgi:hypothetical protein
VYSLSNAGPERTGRGDRQPSAGRVTLVP